MQQDSVPPYLIEQLKLMADYLKHITTLSTGSIVLLTIFLEKLFVKPRWKHLVRTSLCGFTLSLIASVIAFTGLLYPLPATAGGRDLGGPVWAIGLIGTWLGFLVGVISLTAFAVGNLKLDTSERTH
jgi:hypothetical protein